MVNDNFAIAVSTRDGKLLDYVAPLGFPKRILIEALKLGYEVYSIVNVIVKELGYSPPRNITVKTDEYEVTVFIRSNRLVYAVFGVDNTIPYTTSRDVGLAEA